MQVLQPQALPSCRPDSCWPGAPSVAGMAGQGHSISVRQHPIGEGELSPDLVAAAHIGHGMRHLECDPARITKAHDGAPTIIPLTRRALCVVGFLRLVELPWSIWLAVARRPCLPGRERGEPWGVGGGSV